MLVTPAVLPDAGSAFLVSAAAAGVDGIMLLTLSPVPLLLFRLVLAFTCSPLLEPLVSSFTRVLANVLSAIR